MGKTNRNGLAIAIIAIGSISLAGLGIYASNSKASPKPIDKTNTISKPQEPVNVEVTPDDEREQVTSLTPKYEGDDLTFDQTKAIPPAGVDPMVWTVNEYLKTLQAVPATAKALTCTVDSKTLTATLDFNSDIQSGYGTSDEQALINGILTVMGQFKDVKAVKFTVAGQPVESFGNIDLTQPQPVLEMPAAKPTSKE